jgi:hypothetical protein
LIFKVFPGWKIPSWLPMALLVALGGVVFWPALTTPFFLDDHIHSAMVSGRFPAARGMFDLYDFVADDNRRALAEAGFLPWWTDRHLTLRFFRPLSSLLLYWEHRYLEPYPFLLHVHSFGWWVASVFAARAFFRRCVTEHAAAFATVIFALAPCHALPIGWLANREALLALAFGTVGLLAFLRFYEEGGVGWGALSVVAFAMATLSGEYGLAFGGFVLAFAWRGPLTRRWASVLLFLVPAAGYLYLRSHAGYGTTGTGFYQDPLRDPWDFLARAPRRFFVLALSGWFTTDRASWKWDSDLVVVTMTLLFGLGARAALVHVAAKRDPRERERMGTLALGSLLSLLPLLAVRPSVRLVGVPMLGIAPVIGVLLDAAWLDRTVDSDGSSGRDEWVAIAATLLGFAHLLHGPLRGVVNASQIRTSAIDFASHTRDLAARLDEARSGDRAAAQEVVVLRGLDDVFFYGFALEAVGVHVRWTVLSHTGHVLVTRKDASSLDLQVAPDAGLYEVSAGDLYRSLGSPLAVGDEARRDTFRARVLEAGGGGPRRVRFQFVNELEDPSRLWVSQTKARGFEDAPPPKVGFGAPID